MNKKMMAVLIASTIFPGVALAWTAGGSGGSMDIGGNIEVKAPGTPWEVDVGSAVTTLDARISRGEKAVSIPLTRSIPVLGLRNKTKMPFPGQTGITPQIDFNGAVDTRSFRGGVTTMELPVMDADNPATQIGLLQTQLTAAARMSAGNLDGTYAENIDMFAAVPGEAFFGGLPENELTMAADAVATLAAISPDYAANYVALSPEDATPGNGALSDGDTRFNGYYGAGIQAGHKITLTLRAPAASELIKWKASLPVTVSWQ